MRSGAVVKAERPRRHRFVRPGRRGGALRLAALLGAAALVAACTPVEDGPRDQPVSDGGGDAPPASAATPDPALESACLEFYGDPEYTAPLSRVVLDRAGTVRDAGASDPFFYAMTGDDIEEVFEGAPAEGAEAAAALADWFRTEPEQGADADLEGFRTAWEGLAGACRSASAAATWIAEPGDDGTKPGALVCADVFDTPGTLTHFENANVLTSNMFKLVGLSAREVPADRLEDVQATADLLSAEIAAVDDDGVRSALERIREPFADALDGDLASDGLREPLEQLGGACRDLGYDVPEVQDGEDGAVVGAPRPLSDVGPEETA